MRAHLSQSLRRPNWMPTLWESVIGPNTLSSEKALMDSRPDVVRRQKSSQSNLFLQIIIWVSLLPKSGPKWGDSRRSSAVDSGIRFWRKSLRHCIVWTANTIRNKKLIICFIILYEIFNKIITKKSIIFSELSWVEKNRLKNGRNRVTDTRVNQSSELKEQLKTWKFFLSLNSLLLTGDLMWGHETQHKHWSGKATKKQNSNQRLVFLKTYLLIACFVCFSYFNVFLPSIEMFGQKYIIWLRNRPLSD